MAGRLDIPKFKDCRKKLKTHPHYNYPVLSLSGKTHIIIHHGMTKRGLSGANIEGYAEYHVSKGWPGLAYAYGIEPDGTIKWANDIERRTFHVGDHNNYCVGIVLVGDFRYEKPTEAQEDSLRILVHALQTKYSNLKYVKGHQDLPGYEWKNCPAFDYKRVINPPEYPLDKSERLGEVEMLQAMNYRREPALESEVIKVLPEGYGKDGGVHLYEVKDHWLRIGQGWVSNKDNKYVEVSMYEQKPDKLYRVIIDGKQVGAYEEYESIDRQIRQAIESGKGHVKVEKV